MYQSILTQKIVPQTIYSQNILSQSIVLQAILLQSIVPQNVLSKNLWMIPKDAIQICIYINQDKKIQEDWEKGRNEARKNEEDLKILSTNLSPHTELQQNTTCGQIHSIDSEEQESGFRSLVPAETRTFNKNSIVRKHHCHKTSLSKGTIVRRQSMSKDIILNSSHTNTCLCYENIIFRNRRL